jgi:quercetin dioxygenase-like cupin family protein
VGSSTLDDFWFVDGRVRILVSVAQTGGALALVEISAPAGRQPPLHVHRDDDEGFYIVEGELTLWTGDECHLLRVGDYRVAPKRVPHTVRTGESGARYLVTATASFEAFARAAGSPDADRAPDPARLAQLASEHGIEILGPPGMLPGDLPAPAT